MSIIYIFYQKHTKNKTQLICFTDDKKIYSMNVICKPLPEIKIPKEII